MHVRSRAMSELKRDSVTNIVYWRYSHQLIALCTEMLVKFAAARPCPVLIRERLVSSPKS